MSTVNRLIVGRFRVLRARLLDDIEQIKAGDPLAPVVVLVGSNLLGLELRRALAARIGGHLNVRFLTFVDLARALGEAALLEAGLLPLPRGGDELIARGLAAAMPDGSYFSSVADSPGFAGSLLRTFTDLRDGGFRRWPLSEARTLGIARASRCSPKKLAQLAGLFDDYAASLGGRFFDRSDGLDAAAEHAAVFASAFGTDRLLIYGFYDFSATQRRLLAACARVVDATAYVPELPAAAEAFARPTLEWFCAAGFALERIAEAGGEDTDLARLQHHLLDRSPDAERADSDATVELLSAPGEVREVREVARRVVRLAEQGVPFHRIGIILRQPTVYLAPFIELFDRLGVPCYLREGLPLSRTPLGRGVRMLLDLVGTEMRRFDVMEFLCYADIRFAKLLDGFEPSPSHWDRLTLEAGIASGPDEWRHRLRTLAAELRSQLRDDVDSGRPHDAVEADLAAVEHLDGCLGSLFKRLDELRELRTWPELAEATVALIEELLDVGDSPLPDVLRGLGDLGELQPTTDFATFRQAASSALDAASPSRGTFGRGGVCICDTLASRGLEFDVVILPGLVEKSFPAPSRQDPILLDAERERLNAAVGGDARVVVSQRRADEEGAFLALAVGAARKRAILSFPRVDVATGRERLPSSFVLSIARAVSGRAVDYSQIEKLPWCTRVPLSELASPSPQGAVDISEYDLACADAASEGNGRLGHLAGEYAPLARAAQADAKRWSVKLTEYDGFVGRAEALSAMLKKPVSPTRLERYAACPFRFFLERELGIEILEDVADLERISPMDRGQLAHGVLERFFSMQRDKARLPLRPADRDALLEDLHECFEHEAGQLERRGVVGYPLAWRIDREGLEADLVEAVEREIAAGEDWVPEVFEVVFGSEPPVPFDLAPGRTLHFRGRIDRIDRIAGQRRARVIDYKTGKGRYKSDTFEGGCALQLPVYLLAARARLEYPMAGLSAEYRKVAGGGEAAVFSGERWQDREGDFRAILTAIADGIEAGLFPPWPAEDRCSMCDVRRVCGAESRAAIERKLADPRLSGLHRMRSIDA